MTGFNKDCNLNVVDWVEYSILPSLKQGYPMFQDSTKNIKKLGVSGFWENHCLQLVAKTLLI